MCVIRRLESTLGSHVSDVKRYNSLSGWERNGGPAVEKAAGVYLGGGLRLSPTPWR